MLKQLENQGQIILKTVAFPLRSLYFPTNMEVQKDGVSVRHNCREVTSGLYVKFTYNQSNIRLYYRYILRDTESEVNRLACYYYKKSKYCFF